MSKNYGQNQSDCSPSAKIGEYSTGFEASKGQGVLKVANPDRALNSSPMTAKNKGAPASLPGAGPDNSPIKRQSFKK